MRGREERGREEETGGGSAWDCWADGEGRGEKCSLDIPRLEEEKRAVFMRWERDSWKGVEKSYEGEADGGW